MANVSSSNGIEKYPKLRFPEFTEPWSHIKLSDFTERVMRKNKNNETNLPLTISSKDGLVDQVTFFNKTVASKDMSGYYLLKKGEYAYNKSYSVGYDFGSIKRLERYPMGALSTLYICFALTKYNSDYIKTYFDSLKWYKEIYMISAEGARNHGLLNVPTDEFFSTFHYITEDLKEQEKIAKLMQLIELRIQKQQALVDNLKKYKRGVIRTIFNDNISFGKNVKLKEVACIYDGTHQTPEYTTQGVKFVSVENIEDLLGSKKHISSMAFYKDFKVFPEAGDVLMTRIGDIGRAAYVNFSEKIAFYVSLALFKCSSKLNGEYLRHFICTDQFQKELWERTLHIAFPKKINTGEIGECHVVLPPINEQIKIATICSSIDKKIYLSEKELSLLQFMKAGLQQQLFI